MHSTVSAEMLYLRINEGYIEEKSSSATESCDSKPRFIDESSAVANQQITGRFEGFRDFFVSGQQDVVFHGLVELDG